MDQIGPNKAKVDLNRLKLTKFIELNRNEQKLTKWTKLYGMG